MNLTAILEEALQAVAVANDINALEEVRVAFMGKKGSITELLKSLGAMDPETRKEAWIGTTATFEPQPDAAVIERVVSGVLAGFPDKRR